MTLVYRITVIVVPIVLLVSIACRDKTSGAPDTAAGGGPNKTKNAAEAGDRTFDISVPKAGRSAPVSQIEDVFKAARPGTTVTIRLRFRELDIREELYCDSIHLERGELTFVSTQGQFRFVPGDKVLVKPGVLPERTAQFTVRPHIFVMVDGNEDGGPTAGLGIDNVAWDREEQGDLTPYFGQQVSCRRSGTKGAIVELKVHFSDDYAGRVIGWTSHHPP
jgi:hypothetical protein